MSNASLARPVSDVHSRPYNISPTKRYLFTPAGFDVKLTICILIGAAGVVGFLGNVAVFRFVRRKEKERPRAARASNLNHFICSLALSDILGSIICVPLLIINWSVDVFQTGWPCNVARFFIFLFPSVTMYNLMVISLERYILICHATSRPLSRNAVQKLVKGAWGLGILIALAASYTVNGVRVELSETHYTVVCKVDNDVQHKAAISQATAITVYVAPLLVIFFTSVCIIRAVWRRKFNAGNAGSDEARRSKQTKATILLLIIIVAFIVPYAFLIGYTIYANFVKLPKTFKRDFLIRCIGAILAYLNGAINFVIHLLQLPGFAMTLRRRKVQDTRRKPETRKEVPVTNPQAVSNDTKIQDGQLGNKAVELEP